MIGVDIDSKYIQKTKQMLEEKFDEAAAKSELINLNIKEWQVPASYQGRKFVDTVITNPPFGTKEEGIDVKFLEKAMRKGGYTLK